MNSLSDLQNWMSWIISDPRGVKAALENSTPEYASRNEPPLRCLEEVVAQNSDERVHRLHVYAEAYFARILETLEEDYPLCKKILGDDDFAILAASYLKVYPSRTPNLVEVGDHLPAFIEESFSTEEYPYLSFLAHIELANTRAFYAPSPATAKLSKLAVLGQEKLFSSKVLFHSSMQFVSSDWNVDALLHANSEPARECHETPTLYLIFRNDQNILRVRSFGDWQKQVLLELHSGKSFAEALGGSESEDIEETDIQKFFASLITEGIIWDFYE